MRLHAVVLVAAIQSIAAFQQRVVAHTASAEEIIIPPSLDISNYSESIATAPPALDTGVKERPAFDASIMGLIIFSAAGMVLF
ncbi:hypothetical protein GGS20DRAFT_486882 [Poronia punctata]|nr:hypothetical protein GGS20DRAFT_486882 [Poronia punctata]